MERVNWPRTRDILISIICIGIILWYAWGLLFGLFVHAVVLLLLSMALAFLLTPAVNYLQKNNMPRVIATLVMYAFLLIALGALAYAIVFSLIQQVLTFQVTVVNYANALPDRLTALQKFLVSNGIPQSSINDALNQIRGQATAFATALANNVLNIALIVTNTFIDILLIVVLSFYFTLDGKHIRDSLIGIAPKKLCPHYWSISLCLRDNSYGWANARLYSCHSYFLNLARPVSTYLLDRHLLRCCPDD